MTNLQLKNLAIKTADRFYGDPGGQGYDDFVVCVLDALTIAVESERRDHDPKEVHEIRVQIDQKLYVSGSLEDMVKEAFQEGYKRAGEDGTI